MRHTRYVQKPTNRKRPTKAPRVDLAVNDGGRIRRTVGDLTRVIDLVGKVTVDAYVVLEERSDRRGHILLQNKRTGVQCRVNYRRLVPYSADKACLIKSGNRTWAVCPACTALHAEYTDSISCCGTYKVAAQIAPVPECISNLLAGQPMTNDEAATPAADKLDVASLASLPDCELWAKRNLRFDDERTSVSAHALLCVSGKPRKLCFNTYNGMLGKRGGELPVQEFLADSKPVGRKGAVWYYIDAQKARQKLIKDGYEKIEPQS
jgi:hypothetical protein